MHDLGIRYLARVFVDAMSIDGGPKSTAALMERLKRRDLEALTGFEQVGTTAVPRPFIRQKDESWQLVLTSQSFDVSVVASKWNKGKFGSFEKFCRDAAKTLVTCMTFYDRKARRLAAVQEGLMMEMSDGEMDDVARKLFRFSPTFETHHPFEWDWRCASAVDRSFGTKKEPINTIATIKRTSGAMGFFGAIENAVPFDRVRVDLDINTRDQNKSTRFVPKDVTVYFSAVPKWQAELSKELQQLMFGKDHS